MTDIDALARQVREQITRWFMLRQQDRVETTIAEALTTAREEGRSEGFAAGVQAMRERAAVQCDDYARDGRLQREYACEVADEIAARIRALPLPDEKEKP